MGKVKRVDSRGKKHKSAAGILGDDRVMSRKAQRKEKRNLVKLRRHAHNQGKQLPTLESLREERESEIRKVKEKELADRKKRKRKAEKKRTKLKLQEKKSSERQAVVDGIKNEEREIKKYEKLLRLNKRKSKTISQGFKNDGLDFLLEAVDPEVLKTVMDSDDDDIEGDAVSALDRLADDDIECGGSEKGDEGLSSDGEKSASDDGGDSDSCEESDGGDSELRRESDGADNSTSEESDGSVESDEDYSGYYWPSDEDDVSLGNENTSEGKSCAEEVNLPQTKTKRTSLTGSEGVGESQAGILTETKASKKTRLKKLVRFECGPETEKSASNNRHKQKQLQTREIKSEACSDAPPAKKLKSETRCKKVGGKASEGVSLGTVQAEQKDSKETEIKRPKKKKKKNKKGEPKLQTRREAEDVGDNAVSFGGKKSEADGASDNMGSTQEVQYKEDIYGRLRDEAGNIVTPQTAYVPPGKRMALEASVDEKKKLQLQRLKRQLKGQFNRLSESNMQSIANHIEELFRSHSRAELTQCLSDLLLESLVSAYPVPERLIMEHCLLFAILHSNVGMEIGANLIQTLAIRFEELIKKGNTYGTGKEMDNLVVVLSNLYNFKVLHCLLIFDVMKKFAENFQEKDVDLLLIILRNVGFSLRKDDPLALKEFILQVQNKASNSDSTGENSSRMTFMLEVIMHIKNNNMRKIPNYDPTHLEHLKKLLRNCTASSLGEGELRISLDDLLAAQEKGKWWLVGSAWSGRNKDESVHESVADAAVPFVSDKILELARKQRMNTDVRRNIFCVVMTSEDCVDAFEKLLHLGLKQQQEREIIHVIIDLCLQENSFNPFYAYLAQKFCEYDRRFQRAVQFNLWDKFKVLETLNEGQSTNLASFVSHLVAHKALSLSVLKVIEFSDLDKCRVSLMKSVLSTLLLRHDTSTVQEIFLRVSGSQKLHMLCEGLKLFLRHFLWKGKVKSLTKEEQEVLKERVELAESVLNSRESKLTM